jgi:hypothetical protein
MASALTEFELRPQTQSKFERALALLDEGARVGAPCWPRLSRPRWSCRWSWCLRRRQAREGREAQNAGVRADEPMAEAGRKVLRFHFQRMLDKEDGTRDGGGRRRSA